MQVNGVDTQEQLPLGIIKPQSHTFSPYIECFFENKKLDYVHMIDARFGMAYRFVIRNGRKAYEKGTGKPVLEEIPINMIRLSKEADEDIRADFEIFIKRFLNFGDQRASVYFGVET